MSVLDQFENSVEEVVDRAAGAVFKAPIEPAQIAKIAVKRMKQGKLVGAGRQYAPTLYNVLVNQADDKRLFGFYPTMASEIETYLLSKGTDLGLEFDGRPLVRFISDPKLKRGRFDVIAETVTAQIILQLREEELEYYGIAPKGSHSNNRGNGQSEQGEHNSRKGSADPKDREIEPMASARRPQTPQVAINPIGSNPIDSFELLPPLSSARGKNSAARLPLITPQAQKMQEPQGRAGTQEGNPEQDLSLQHQTANEPSLGSATLHNTTSNETSPLLKRLVVIGRDLNCDIVVSDVNASRKHVRLEQNAVGSWRLIDNNSTNGTLLNNRPVSQEILRDGDLITIGTIVLEFQA